MSAFTSINKDVTKSKGYSLFGIPIQTKVGVPDLKGSFDMRGYEKNRVNTARSFR